MSIDLKSIKFNLQENEIEQYRKFYETYLTRVKNRSQAINDLKIVCEEFRKLAETSTYLGDESKYSTIAKTTVVLKQHFPPSLLVEFDKEVEVELKRRTDDEDPWGLVLLDLFVSGYEQINQKLNKKIQYQNRFIRFTLRCLSDFGLHSKINLRSVDIYGRYHVNIEHKDLKGDWCHFNMINLTNKALKDKFVTPFLAEQKIRLAGKIVPFDNINEIVVKQSKLKDEEIHLYMRKYGNKWKGSKADQQRYSDLCPDVTEAILSDSPLDLDKVKHPTAYVHESRIEELESIGSDYDLTPLCQLCLELNTSWTNGNYMSITMQVRTILNFVPPIFGLSNFAEVANNYSGGGKSFKKQMQFLNDSLKNIADRQLHLQAKKKHTMPNDITVDFSSALDELLAEVVVLSSGK